MSRPDQKISSILLQPKTHTKFDAGVRRIPNRFLGLFILTVAMSKGSGLTTYTHMNYTTAGDEFPQGGGEVERDGGSTLWP